MKLSELIYEFGSKYSFDTSSRDSQSVIIDFGLDIRKINISDLTEIKYLDESGEENIEYSFDIYSLTFFESKFPFIVQLISINKNIRIMSQYGCCYFDDFELDDSYEQLMKHNISNNSFICYEMGEKILCDLNEFIKKTLFIEKMENELENKEFNNNKKVKI